MKKHIILKIFLFSFISSITLAQSQKDYFTLKGTIHGNYNGYLYLNYNDVKDSCIVTKNQFSFKGKIPIATVGYFSTGRLASMANDFYLENGNIKMDISIEKKKVKDF